VLILGIDPGTAITGYGVIETVGNRLLFRDYGVIRTEAGTKLEKRLVQVYDGMSRLIDHWKPDEVAIEELFFNKNTRTALTVGQARGVLLLAAAHQGLPVGEYTPLQVKQAVVGNGRAEKQQVQYMVKVLLNLVSIPKPDDAADALAIAICHAHWHATKMILQQKER
jgi:crossover junction endodeoxyribonuclease RuvC